MIEEQGFKKYLPKILKITFVVLAMLIMYIPVFIIIYQSFNKDANGLNALHFGGITFDNYKDVFTNSSLYRNILDSLLVSFWATLIATVLGLFSAIGINAHSSSSSPITLGFISKASDKRRRIHPFGTPPS